MSMNYVHGSSRVPAARKSFSTIRRVLLPELVADELIDAYLDETLSLHKVPQNYMCDYKFAASVEELAHVARKVVREDIRALELQAPPGVGKTTRFPEHLRLLSKECVVVLEPTPVLAKAQVATVRSHGIAAAYLDASQLADVRISFKSGLTYTTPATFLAYMRMRQLDPGRYTGDTAKLIVLHDECHENDGSTYALKALWPTFTCISRYIKMSATTAGNSVESRQRHNSAQPLVVRKYPPKEEQDIGLDDAAVGGYLCPWSVSAVRTKRTLLFVEDDEVASRLARQYSVHVPVGLLRRTDPYEAYERVQAELARHAGMVVIVDSGYQSGYTFHIDVVVDFGIRQQTTDDGTSQPAIKRRLVTASERRQRVERAGRHRPGIAYVPDEPAEAVDSVLGPGEAGHAAAWFVLLGYRPPSELKLVAADLLYSANLPKFLAAGVTWGLWTREYFSVAVKKASAPVSTGDEVASRDGERSAAPCELSRDLAVVNLTPVNPQLDRTHAVATVEPSQQRLNRVTATDSVESAYGVKSGGSELARDLVTKLSIMVKPGPQPEVRSGRFLCLPNDHSDRGGDYYHSAYAENLACDDDGEVAMRWLRGEVLEKPLESLRRTTAVDKVMRWSVWLATWNYNEAAAAIVLVPVPGTISVVARTRQASNGGEASGCHGWRRCEMRIDLIAIYNRLMVYTPKSLYVINGDYYLRRAARIAYHRHAWLAQINANAHVRAMEFIHVARVRAREARRTNCDTVSSASGPVAAAANLDDERFEEM